MRILLSIGILISLNFAIAAEDPSPYSLFGIAKTKVFYGNEDYSFDETMDYLQYLALVELHHRYEIGAITARVEHDLNISDGTIVSNIYEAYIGWKASDWLDLSIGKKRFVFGSGNLLNPSDTFNPLEQPGSQKSGNRGLIARFSIGQEFGLNLGLGLDRALAPANPDLTLIQYGASFDGQIDALNVGLAYFYSKDFTSSGLVWLGYDFGGLVLSLEASLETDPQVQYLTGTVGSPVINSRDAPLFKGIVELRYIGTLFENDLSFTIDYLYNQGGWNADENQLWQDSVNSLKAPFFRNQHYIWAQVQYSKASDFSLGSSISYNIIDNSARYTIAFAKDIEEKLSIDLGLSLFSGDAKDEYGRQGVKLGNTIKFMNYLASIGLSLNF